MRFSGLLREVWMGLMRHGMTRGGGKRGGGPPISVGQPGSGTSFGYNPVTDTLIREDTMQYSTETTAYIGPSNNWHKLRSQGIANVTDYTVSLDTAASTSATYPIGVKLGIKSVGPAITAGTWTGASDTVCGIEGGMMGSPLNTVAYGGQPSFEFWFSYRRKWDVGFLFSAFDPSTTTPNVTRMFTYKECLIFREPFGSPNGRFSFEATVPQGGTELNGTVGVDFPAAPSQAWRLGINPTATSQKPSAGHLAEYRQTLNNSMRGTNMEPHQLADGNEHEFVFHVRNESVEDAGDGLVQIWIDDLPIMDLDGTNPSSVVSGKMYTRVDFWGTTQWGHAIINGGAVRDQNCWLLGPFRAWTRP